MGEILADIFKQYDCGSDTLDCALERLPQLALNQ
jgi:hypothetical protein